VDFKDNQRNPKIISPTNSIKTNVLRPTGQVLVNTSEDEKLFTELTTHGMKLFKMATFHFLVKKKGVILHSPPSNLESQKELTHCHKIIHFHKLSEGCSFHNLQGLTKSISTKQVTISYQSITKKTKLNNVMIFR